MPEKLFEIQETQTPPSQINQNNHKTTIKTQKIHNNIVHITTIIYVIYRKSQFQTTPNIKPNLMKNNPKQPKRPTKQLKNNGVLVTN